MRSALRRAALGLPIVVSVAVGIGCDNSTVNEPKDSPTPSATSAEPGPPPPTSQEEYFKQQEAQAAAGAKKK